MPNYKKMASLALRFGLAATYIYSGLSLILEPAAWLAYVPVWFVDILPVGILPYLQFQGILELLLAAAFISGILLRPAAFLSALEMLLILVLSGVDGVTFRDLAILGGSLAVFFSTFNNQATTDTPAPSPPEPDTASSSPKSVSDNQNFLVLMPAQKFRMLIREKI